jgi:hypothetical protein
VVKKHPFRSIQAAYSSACAAPGITINQEAALAKATKTRVNFFNPPAAKRYLTILPPLSDKLQPEMSIDVVPKADFATSSCLKPDGTQTGSLVGPAEPVAEDPDSRLGRGELQGLPV